MTKTLLGLLYVLLIIVMITDISFGGFTTHNTMAIIMACIALIALSPANIAYSWIRATYRPALLLAIVWFVLLSLGIIPNLFFITGLFQAVVLAALLYVAYMDVMAMISKSRDQQYTNKWGNGGDHDTQGMSGSDKSA